MLSELISKNYVLPVYPQSTYHPMLSELNIIKGRKGGDSCDPPLKLIMIEFPNI